MNTSNVKNQDLPAFACVSNDYQQDGLTKREYFAAMAMQGIVSNQDYLRDLNTDPDLLVTIILELTDKLLEKLSSEKIIGRKYETTTFDFFIANDIEIAEIKLIASSLLKDGWVADDDFLFYIKDGKKIARCTIRRLLP